MKVSTARERYTCKACGKTFTVALEVVGRFPGWTPRTCLACRPQKNDKNGTPRRQRRPEEGATQGLHARDVLERYSAGPSSGLFTDGACSGNPGPGGWGAVWVHEDKILDQAYGFEERTTNNRMELVALIRAFHLLPPTFSGEIDIYTDSDLCVRTINEWASSWARRGWKRKGGEVKNLDLVKELYFLAQARPWVRLKWLRGHSGVRWNEYADALATAYTREEV